MKSKIQIALTVFLTISLFGLGASLIVNIGEAKLLTSKPSIDTNLLVKNESSTDSGIESKGDFDNNLLITPPIETKNTIDCSIESSLLAPGSDCKGTEKNDKLLARLLTGHGNYTYGLDGSDYILGGNTMQTIYGNDGNDFIYGGKAGELIAGNDGEDKIFGGPGNDVIITEGAEKKPKGYPGNQTEWPPAKDIIDCGEGHDILYADYLDEYANCEDVKITGAIKVETKNLPTDLLTGNLGSDQKQFAGKNTMRNTTSDLTSNESDVSDTMDSSIISNNTGSVEGSTTDSGNQDDNSEN